MFEKVLNKYSTYEKYTFYIQSTYFVFQLSTVFEKVLNKYGTYEKYTFYIHSTYFMFQLSTMCEKVLNKYCTYLVLFQTLYLIGTRNKYYG